MKPLDDHIARLQAGLRTERFGRRCRWFGTVDSTNSLAMTWAKEDAQTGSLVVAEFQERGRGRFKRSWTSDPGRNLMFSMIIDPSELRGGLELLPLAIAVAVTDSLAENIEPHRPLIKWPNDVILTGKKVCGILVESSLPSRSDDRGGRVVAGVGINVNQDSFPEDLSETATSLYRVLGRQVDRIELLCDILSSFEAVHREIVAGRTVKLIRRYESMMLGLGETARFLHLGTGRMTEGTILGVDDAGGLRVQTKSAVEVLRAGEVTIRMDGSLPQARIARLSDQSFPTSSS
ncbi:MAG TPA: biotin--[acetyl-CoA-carboxylase] ligase [Rhodothermia bacterium]